MQSRTANAKTERCIVPRLPLDNWQYMRGSVTTAKYDSIGTHYMSSPAWHTDPHPREKQQGVKQVVALLLGVTW